jgi:hypothetical protein
VVEKGHEREVHRPQERNDSWWKTNAAAGDLEKPAIQLHEGNDKYLSLPRTSRFCQQGENAPNHYVRWPSTGQ